MERMLGDFRHDLRDVFGKRQLRLRAAFQAATAFRAIVARVLRMLVDALGGAGDAFPNDPVLHRTACHAFGGRFSSTGIMP